MTATYKSIDCGLERLVREEKDRFKAALMKAAESFSSRALERSLQQELDKFNQRAGEYYWRGWHFLSLITCDLSKLERVERLSYLRGLLQSLEKYEGGKRLVKVAGLSEQELYGSKPERTRPEEKAILEDTRAALRGGSLDGQCNYCRKKVDSETCLIRLLSPASNDGTIYCDDGCFRMYTED